MPPTLVAVKAYLIFVGWLGHWPRVVQHCLQWQGTWVGNITAVSIDRPLQRFMKQFVAYLDLKGLCPGVVKESHVALQLAAAVTALTDVTIKADQRNKTRQEEAKEDKEIGSLLPGSQLDTLVSLVQVPPSKSPENALPVLWSKFPNKKKNNSNHSLFQQSANDAGVSLKIKVPVIPLSAVTSLLSLMWDSIDPANLGSGILPMAFIPPDAISPKAKTAVLALMMVIQSAGDATGNMTLVDSVALNQAGGNIYISIDFPESEVQIKCFLPILCAMVGTEHDLFKEYSDSWDFIEEHKLEFQ